MADRQVVIFDSESKLEADVLAAIVNWNLLPAPNPNDKNRMTYLLFPWVKCEGSIDTGIVISNTGSDPFGTVGQGGVCVFHYYGKKANGDPPGGPQFSAVVMPGETLAHVLSQNTTGTNGLSSRVGFSGYVIVECNFPYAHAVASMTSTQAPLLFYAATVIKRDRNGE